jgi:hypothetical protein
MWRVPRELIYLYHSFSIFRPRNSASTPVSIATCQVECDRLLEDIRKELVPEQNNNDDHDDNTDDDDDDDDDDEDYRRQQQQLEEEEHVLGLRVLEPQPFDALLHQFLYQLDRIESGETA